MAESRLKGGKYVNIDIFSKNLTLSPAVSRYVCAVSIVSEKKVEW